jgi:DNA-binding HxlR family transcriptional regulator
MLRNLPEEVIAMGKLREPLNDDQSCGLPAALEVMGERWSFMILRAGFNGVHHFEEFLSELGIARNILSNRLARLVEHGIMKREPLPDDRRKIEYRLTEKGMDLLPAMLTLRQWGEKYGCGVPSNPVLCDRRAGEPIAKIGIHAHDGRELHYSELVWLDRADLGKPYVGEDESEVRPQLAALR